MDYIRETREELINRAALEGWHGHFDLCPHCKTGAVCYGNETRRGDRYDNFHVCSCSYCDREWFEDFEEE